MDRFKIKLELLDLLSTKYSERPLRVTFADFSEAQNSSDPWLGLMGTNVQNPSLTSVGKITDKLTPIPQGYRKYLTLLRDLVFLPRKDRNTIGYGSGYHSMWDGMRNHFKAGDLIWLHGKLDQGKYLEVTDFGVYENQRSSWNISGLRLAGEKSG